MQAEKHIDREQVRVRDILFTWSNFISLTRIFAALPVVYIYHTNGQTITPLIVGLIVYAILSDYLDGYIARKTDRVTEWGKILDPVADKICAFILFLYAVWAGLIPLWFFVVEVARDALIMSGSYFIKWQHGKVPMAVMSGKWSVNALAAYWMSAFFFPELTGVQLFFMGISLTLMFFSLIDYFHRFVLIRQGAEFN